MHKDGPACHTGADSCFNEVIYEGEADGEFSLDALMKVIEGRKIEKKEGSYTTYLFQKGIDKILKKIGEESTEVIIAGKANDKAEAIYEISDLAYHVMVMMVEMGIEVEFSDKDYTVLMLTPENEDADITDLAIQLNLTRVSAPLFVSAASGLNDDLNGVERPVAFDVNGVKDTAQVVHSLAKWKRLALYEYGFHIVSIRNYHLRKR